MDGMGHIFNKRQNTEAITEVINYLAKICSHFLRKPVQIKYLLIHRGADWHNTNGH